MGLFSSIGKVLQSTTRPLRHATGVDKVLNKAANTVGLGKTPESVKRGLQEQTNAYENQMRSVQAESARMNENIMRQSQRVAAGVARQNRSRIRGGGFGDNAGQNAVGDRLG